MILRDEPAIRSVFELVAEVVRKLDIAIPRGSTEDCYEARLVRAEALLLRDLLSDLLGARRVVNDHGAEPMRRPAGISSNGQISEVTADVAVERRAPSARTPR